MNRLSLAHLAIAAIVFSFVLAPTPSLAQQKVRLGLSSISATNGSVWVAEEKNLFKKHGVDVEVVERAGFFKVNGIDVFQHAADRNRVRRVVRAV
jgi:ABC-type nitrate/sulfonate/bicarbonate transport system substrate-binding protein